jgi:hypothetical protein
VFRSAPLNVGESRNAGAPPQHDVLSSVFAYPAELDVWWHSRPDLQRTSTPLPSASIAVLPFLNLNRDEENQILSDGLEDLINALAQVDGLHVVARTSAFQFQEGISTSEQWVPGSVFALGARRKPPKAGDRLSHGPTDQCC